MRLETKAQIHLLKKLCEIIRAVKLYFSLKWCAVTNKAGSKQNSKETIERSSGSFCD